MAESIEQVEKRHKQEIRDMDGKVRALLKTAKKSNKAVIEAEAIQMGYDLKARQSEEYDLFAKMEALGVDDGASSDSTVTSDEAPDETVETDAERRIREEEESAIAKKMKAQKKKDKKITKDVERLQKKQEINSNAGPSMREVELERINELLGKQDLTIKLIASDGHCLYRSIADQLDQLWLHKESSSSSSSASSEEKKHDFISLRMLASTYLRQHGEEYAPFLGMIPSDAEYGLYCDKVESVNDAEWGGQLEIKALCHCLNRSMMIYSADAPVLIMGEEHLETNLPLKLAYHRHFYALGEHYNSVANIVKDCTCCAGKEKKEVI